MEKHDSLLLITYLCSLLLGMALAFTATQLPPDLSTQSLSILDLSAPWNCLNASCYLLPDVTVMLSITIIAGGALAFTSLLLSRGLYRLFFAESG